MDQFIKVTGTEDKVGGYFCRLPPLNENTGQLVRGVTYEILDLYRFLVTELVFLDDYLLNYMSLICHRDKI